ncbi:hypothetical protein AHF37_06055 [Paragonimus kellicotti]|nr:hypothetical protein AHF37_06055 [Paragonimus kellicotti]
MKRLRLDGLWQKNLNDLLFGRINVFNGRHLNAVLAMGSSEASTRRRVKLYMLNDERQWDDKGTGHVSAVCTEQDNMALVVISETDGSYLLESKIQPDTAYQKQQETLIVWSEGESMDLALSFQEKGKDPSVEITQEVVDESDDADDTDGYAPITIQSVQPLPLPPCEFGHLEETADMISQAVASPQKRERLVALLESTNYLNQLIDVFHKAEDLKDLESLHHLYEIIRQLILINKQSLYETLFADDMLMDVIGMLEYNPSGRTRHRDFLRNKATFREVLPLHNSELVSKIHQTYRVQYIQECCLPPPCLFDEHTLSQLKTFVSLNKLEIIRALQDDEEFMCRLFARLKSPDTELSHCRELSLFVKEFCNISIQTDQKESFLSCLFQHGALRTAEVLLAIEDKDIKSAALEILQAFVEHQPSVVRGYVYRETASFRKDDELLINLMINQLLADSDPELSDAFLLSYMLRILIDPDNMNNPGVRGEKSEFLGFFYKRCFNTLVRPLFENTVKDVLEKDDYHTALVLNHILELLTFCIESHTYHMKNYCLNRDLLKRVLVLLQSSHKFLVLAALRLLRRVIHMKEEFYNRYLIKNNLFKPVIKLFVANGHRYNLIDSAIIELFDYIRSEEIASLINHVVENFWDILKNVNYVKTFNELKRAYDHSHRPARPPIVGSVGQQASLDVLSLVNVAATRFQRDPRALEIEEEQWFDQDDDEEDDEEESNLFSTQPTSLINGGINGASPPGALPVGPIPDGLSTLPRYDVHSVTSTPSSELLGLSALGGSQTAFTSLGSTMNSDSRDSIFCSSASTAAGVNLFKTGVPDDALSVTNSGRSSSTADRLRVRQLDVDSDAVHGRPHLPRQPSPISIHIKSALSSNESDQHSSSSPVTADFGCTVEDQSSKTCEPAAARCSPVFEGDAQPKSALSNSHCQSDEVGFPDSAVQHKRGLSVEDLGFRSSKRLKKSPQSLVTTRTTITSIDNLFSDDLSERPCLASDLVALRPTSFESDSAVLSDPSDEDISSVGLVDYSDEESGEEDESDGDGKIVDCERTLVKSVKSVSPDDGCEVSSSQPSTDVV